MTEQYKFSYKKHTLRFIKPAGTSRGILTEKPSYFIYIKDNRSGVSGIGECSLLPGLSPDYRPEVEKDIKTLCEELNKDQWLYVPGSLNDLPAVRFGLETAIRNLMTGGCGLLFKNDFSRGKEGIPINGLIWMGGIEDMKFQLEQKLKQGFRCIKIKIGALDFDTEIAFISDIRKRYGGEIELRLDANGAFDPTEALAKLTKLAAYDIHSVEQPIRQGLWEQMSYICRNSPIPIALDEELIGVNVYQKKKELLETIKPHYLILKPSLIGGFAASDEWIALSKEFNIGWWATSALESNIGLNAIAQWVASKKNPMPQGLGTGALFENNIEWPFKIEQGKLWLNGLSTTDRLIELKNIG